MVAVDYVRPGVAELELQLGPRPALWHAPVNIITVWCSPAALAEQVSCESCA